MFAIIGALAALFNVMRGTTVWSAIRRVTGPHVRTCSFVLTRAAVASDVCCFACIWAALIIASYLFLEVRCDGHLALANRGYRIAPDASPSGYVSLLSAAVASAVASAVALLARATVGAGADRTGLIISSSTCAHSEQSPDALVGSPIAAFD